MFVCGTTVVVKVEQSQVKGQKPQDLVWGAAFKRLKLIQVKNSYL